MSQRLGEDTGSASVLAVGVASVAITCVIASGAVGHASAARAALDATADATALAAADTVAGFVSGDPCEVAARAAALNRARLVACSIAGADVVVVVGASVLGIDASSRARAGPPR